jgi:cytokinesis protein
MEETRKRNEASMRRKQLNTSVANANGALASPSDVPGSPASTGAMDVLLEKLRAAKPEAREQRDRRRRARLKDRHQVRVASGQKIPEIKGVGGSGGEYDAGADSSGGGGLMSPKSDASSDQPLSPIVDADGAPGSGSGSAGAGGGKSDVADRAASLLQGLRRDDGQGADDAARMRRRRETADEERSRRRNRRRQAQSSISEQGGGIPTPPVQEGDENEDAEGAEGMETTAATAAAVAPMTVVSPPSPEHE